jgi:predicted esterase
MRWLLLAFFSTAACVALACEGDVTETSAGAGANTGNSTNSTATGMTSSGGSGGSVTGVTCFDAPPSGAEQPPAPPSYSGGTCPMLMTGRNQMTTGGNMREFIVVEPSDRAPGEVLPLIFLWHWLGGDAQGFVDQGEVQASADLFRFVAVVPEEKGDVQFTWPMDLTSSQTRVDEELLFFDDMLACASEQLEVQAHCVSSAGVSAGALFTSAIVAPLRGQYLSSFLSLSGGVGGVIKPWQSSAHKMPAIVLWGGPTDNCAGLLSFEDLSHSLEDGLTADGHFFLECVHNCGHAQPPFDGAATTTAPLWRFILDHPYWLPDGESPYQSGIPADVPTWCAIGAGSATPRTGECLNPSEC